MVFGINSTSLSAISLLQPVTRVLFIPDTTKSMLLHIPINWVISQQSTCSRILLCVGQPPMGALLSKRNSINYAIEANTLQLIKRERYIFCAEETNNLAT